MAFQINNKILTDYATSLGHPPRAAAVKLFGLRGAEAIASDQIGLRENKLDYWNDVVGIWGTKWDMFKATLEPGKYYTENPLDKDGAAHLMGLEQGGQVWKFKWGIHQKSYKALVQAESFDVRRDKNRDGEPDLDEPIEHGYFGINIHYGGKMEQVGKWSAGCQVLFGGAVSGSPWNQCRSRLNKVPQATYDYYLMDARGLAKFLGLI